MKLRLSQWDETMLAGKLGEAVRMAMSIIVRMAEIEGAEEPIDFTGAHIDATLYQGHRSLEFAERFAALGSRVAISTTPSSC